MKYLKYIGWILYEVIWNVGELVVLWYAFSKDVQWIQSICYFWYALGFIGSIIALFAAFFNTVQSFYNRHMKNGRRTIRYEASQNPVMRIFSRVQEILVAGIFVAYGHWFYGLMALGIMLFLETIRTIDKDVMKLNTDQPKFEQYKDKYVYELFAKH